MEIIHGSKKKMKDSGRKYKTNNQKIIKKMTKYNNYNEILNNNKKNFKGCKNIIKPKSLNIGVIKSKA